MDTNQTDNAEILELLKEIRALQKETLEIVKEIKAIQERTLKKPDKHLIVYEGYPKI